MTVALVVAAVAFFGALTLPLLVGAAVAGFTFGPPTAFLPVDKDAFAYAFPVVLLVMTVVAYY